MASRSLWKGQLKLGDLLVPVKLVNASAPASTFDVGFHFAHRCSARRLTRINKKTWCGHCETHVDETVRVIEYAKDRHIEITADDLKGCEPAENQLLQLTALLDDNDVDPVYVDAAAYLVPDGPGDSTAYDVVRAALGKAIAIARVVINKRTATVALRAVPGRVLVYILKTKDEVRDITHVAAEHNVTTRPQRRDDVRRVQQLLEQLDQDFDIRNVHDDYAQRVRRLIERKSSQFTKPARKRAVS